MSTSLIFALILAICGLMFPFIALVFRYIGKISPKPERDQYSDIRASILLLNITLPTVLFLLGAFGFTTYDAIVNKVTENVTLAVNKEINRDKVEAVVKDIESLNRQAKEDADAILQLKTTMEDTINQEFEKFSRIFPVGTILPYFGARDSIDFNFWAICDGTRGTPDLRDRFLLGSSFLSIGEKGGQARHDHKASATIEGQVNKKGTIKYPLWDGTGKKREFEVHDHTLRLSPPKVNISDTRTLPPYIRMVYLMKVK